MQWYNRTCECLLFLFVVDADKKKTVSFELIRRGEVLYYYYYYYSQPKQLERIYLTSLFIIIIVAKNTGVLNGKQYIIDTTFPREKLDKHTVIS